MWGLTTLMKALSSLDHSCLSSFPLICCKQGFAHLPLPFSCPDCPVSMQTWLFAHSCELLFRLKFFRFLVALIPFHLQPCPKTLKRAVIPIFLKNISSSLNRSNLQVFFSLSSHSCFCLTDKIINFGLYFCVKHVSIIRSDNYTWWALKVGKLVFK